MIPVLPRQQLLGQHRELCAIRGLSWGKKHSTINYVFRHNWETLFNFHLLIITEMKYRGYKPNPLWSDFFYRGKRMDPHSPVWVTKTGRISLYKEHNEAYKTACAKNLEAKLRRAPAGKYNETEVYRFYSWLSDEGISLE
jgi:uncharacterized protein (TIGR02328 family)